MVASIALMRTLMYQSQSVQICCNKNKRNVLIRDVPTVQSVRRNSSFIPIKKLGTKKSFMKTKPAKKTEQKTEIKDNINKHSFFDNVWDVARQIPKGRVTSYGAIAAYLGTKMSARMVGWAMAASVHAKPKVPAQRVVNRNGMLSGKMHFATPDAMQQLLEKDGVTIEKDKVVDFQKRFWDPVKELVL